MEKTLNRKQISNINFETVAGSFVKLEQLKKFQVGKDPHHKGLKMKLQERNTQSNLDVIGTLTASNKRSALVKTQKYNMTPNKAKFDHHKVQ